MRLLGGLGPGPDLVEVDVLAVELGLVLCPDLLHRPHLLAETLEARLVVRAVVLHLFGIPPAPDAELEAPARERVEARHLLGGDDRVALDDEADARADPDALGRRRGGHEGHERIESVGILRG